MNREKDILGFGHFLEHRHWRQAVTLLEYQLERKKTNRHFNTLEMTYYQKMRKSFNRLKSDKYFITRVANNLFYGLSREFAVIPYTIPKSNLGLRRYKFMTCPMRVLYYAVGIYLIELSKDYLKASHGTQKARIHASYGGNLQFNEHGKLIKKPEPIPDPIYYKPHYDNFCKEVKKENEKNTERKVVIRLDIQNFFDELHIPMLLILLRDYVKPSISKKMCFDETTRAQLNSFFDFIGGGRSGIPQSDNNIISSFIGHLFLSFGDLYLDDELRKQDDLIANHRIIRYMDDIYISTAFKEQDRDLRTKFLNSIAPRISDCLHDKLGLRLNPKTRLFDLRIDGDREALERNLKRVSEGIEIVDEDNTPPKEKIKRIFGQLKKLKRFPIAPYFPEHPDPDSNEEEFNEEKFKDILKEVYDKRVEQMLKIPKKKLQLENLFTSSGGFDFELVNTYPMPIIVLIIASDDVRKKFDKFLRSKTYFTSRDAFLTLNYLCQTEFAQKKMLNLLKRDCQLGKILEIFKQKGLRTKSPGYYDVTQKQVLKIAKPHIIEQIRSRVLAEQKGDYSVALNHLLNEIQAICHMLVGGPADLHEFKAPQVSTFLARRNVPHESCTQIGNLFNRRNKSPISHADPIAWAVTREEYEGYRCHVGKCLKHLL